MAQKGKEAKEEETHGKAQDAQEEDGLPALLAQPPPDGGKEELHEGVAGGEKTHLDLGEPQLPAQRPQDGEEDGKPQDAVEKGQEEEAYRGHALEFIRSGR